MTMVTVPLGVVPTQPPHHLDLGLRQPYLPGDKWAFSKSNEQSIIHVQIVSRSQPNPFRTSPIRVGVCGQHLVS